MGSIREDIRNHFLKDNSAEVIPAIKKVILLNSAADVIKYFQGDIPDYSEAKILNLPDDIRVTKELYLKSLQLMEEAKHIH